MRRTAAEKPEFIRLVETSDLPVRATLEHLSLAKSTFYDWYERYRAGGVDALEDRKPKPRAGRNTVPQAVRKQVIDTALERTELSARELACHFIDKKRYFLSESSVYRILEAHDLVVSPAYVLMSAADKFQQPTRWRCGGASTGPRRQPS